MATPVWTTTAGKIATIDEQVAYSLQLEANTSDSTAITYSVIAGSLPAGMQVTSTGLLTGTPAEVARGKIAGCENIPLHLIPLKVAEFKADEKIVIYCQTGARSAQACAFLASKGINGSINVRGGIVAWAQMGYPISA